MNKCIGIIGGMGPLATCDLMKKIITSMNVKTDQEYVRICVDCNTNIPDRTTAILHEGKTPLHEMVKSAVRLQGDGADVLTIACNTAHHYYDEIKQYVDIPILHMPQETANALKRENIQNAAILATDGTVQCGIYDRALNEAGIRPVYPNAQEQQLIMKLIYQCVKAGESYSVYIKDINAMVERLKNAGAQALVLGCTELPIVFDELQLDIPCVDPTEILARAAIQFCRYGS